ncbi:MAG TPA: 3-dehydroquinate synthase [Granulicella sp.]
MRYHGFTVPSIPVTTPSASYDVVIGSGLLRTLYPRLKKLTGGKPFRPFIITSPEIWGLWSSQVLVSFPEEPTVLFQPRGETKKRMASVEALAEQLAQSGADRDSLLIALGGGIIGDITGFVAAIYMRGIPYLQVPTTLLAQVDSAIGGKTGVNLAAGKNLVGSFHHPLAVLADSEVLGTLPAEELRAGLQEVVKSAIIRDARLFKYLESHAEDVLAGDPDALAKVVTAAVRVKADVVSQDEKESGLRMILNFGHTLGHAIEAATKYKVLLHGQAVGWGSIAAAELSRSRGTITEKQYERIVNLILAYGPLPPFRAKAETLVDLTWSDKKARSGKRAFVLAKGIGATETIFDATDEELIAAAQAMLERVRKA